MPFVYLMSDGFVLLVSFAQNPPICIPSLHIAMAFVGFLGQISRNAETPFLRAAMGDVVDIDSEDDLPEMRQWTADVQEVCPNVPSETVAQVLLETRDPIKAIHKLLDRGRFAEFQQEGGSKPNG